MAKDLPDMRERIDQIVVGEDMSGAVVRVADLDIGGALCALIRDTQHPTLLQTMEGTPVLVHAGPLASTGQGNSSVIADLLALKLVGEQGFVVTESAYGTDIGLEKYVNIKSRQLPPARTIAVIVCTLPTLRSHASASAQTSTQQVVEGCEANLTRHIANARKLGLQVIVAINQSSEDAEDDLEAVMAIAQKAGAFRAVLCDPRVSGGLGALELARAVVDLRAESTESRPRPLYDAEHPIEAKIQTICREMYGAAGISVAESARAKIAKLTAQGYSRLPICLSKNPRSLLPSDASSVVTVSDVYVNAGAGFLVVLTDQVNVMPGLPVRPRFMDIDIDLKTSAVTGLGAST
eukprot:m.411539 g.411539  ORF g.411539 m.411539 type:complete len:350 (+) comp56554_c0_seq7:1833-2882(+)